MDRFELARDARRDFAVLRRQIEELDSHFATIAPGRILKIARFQKIAQT
jgi:hypothetical protein